jgi:hypothetical protein
MLRASTLSFSAFSFASFSYLSFKALASTAFLSASTFAATASFAAFAASIFACPIPRNYALMKSKSQLNALIMFLKVLAVTSLRGWAISPF